jgi:RNA polymerase sigma factor (sigma-70 family)
MYTANSEPARIVETRRHLDADLVARANGGDEAAFEAIMRQHNRLLFRSARGIVADDAEAQDVVQETYLKAFSALQTFRGDCALGSWLARIAIRVALDQQRKNGRIVSLDERPGIDTPTPMETLMERNAPATETPDSYAERAQLRATLQRAIDSLPPIYRSVFILRAVEEMSVEDAASCLHVSTDVVKTRYLRARALLRDALGAQLEAHTQHVYAFAGARCDAVVAHVLAELQRRGRIRGSG